MKKFYDRKKELESLKQIENQSKEAACFTVLVGRRRVGKTELLKKFLSESETKSAYLFTARMSESMLCENWQKELEKIGLKIFGKITSLSELFEQIMIFSQTEHFSLVIDEFQDVALVNKSFFSQMQNIWDSYKNNSKINLIVCGSVYSMMTKIFEDEKEPLFARSTHKIHLKEFSPSVVKEILSDFNPSFTNEDLLCLFMLSGGTAKYISLLMNAKAWTKESMIKYALSVSSPFLIDGKEILVSEMGKDYGIYFSILRLISEGKTLQSEIDSVIQKNTGAYLQNLEKIFNVIKPIKPILSKSESRNTRWQITDEYMRFYFRFIFANQNLIELEQNDLLEEIVNRDYTTFSGITLEHYFSKKFAEEKRLTNLGGWWDKKSNNEIDIIALNSLEKTCEIFEVKRQSKNLDMSLVKSKADIFLENNKSELKNFTVTINGISMEEM